jgi:hypothetical protein
MDIVTRLDAIQDISRLKARYFRCLDTKDWNGFEQLFTPDASFDMRNGRGENMDPNAVVHGATAIREFVSNAVARRTTVHHGHTPEIEVIDGSHARGIWPMHDVLVVPEDVDLPFKRFEGFGHYHETYERRQGRWLIRTLCLTRLHIAAS